MELRIATRRSALALWQAEHVAAALTAAHAGLRATVLPMSTRGDEMLDMPLSLVGGKALFTHELERAMMDGRADLAVHSLKDMPAELPAGMTLAAVLKRADAADAFVSTRHDSIDSLPEGARVGTSSLRRIAQLRYRFPMLEFVPLRGNLNTRLARLDDGDPDAAILAVAGLERLGMRERIRHALDPDLCLPAIGQGVLGIECRSDDTRTLGLVRALEHGATRACITAERAVSRHLAGSCHAPIAAYAVWQDGRLRMRARVGTPDGRTLLESAGDAMPSEAMALGVRLAEELLAQGAGAILAEHA